MKAPTPGALEKKIAAMERSTWIMEHLSPSSCIGDVGDAASSDGRFVRSGWQFDMDISRNLQLISLMMTHIGNRIRVRYWSLHHFIFRTVYQFQNHVDSRWHLTSALWTKKFPKVATLQWSTEPKQDSVIFGFRFGSARFGSFRFFQENRTEYLQDKIKYKRVSRSFNRNIFLKKIQW